MTDPVCPAKADLLAAFNETFDKIRTEGGDHKFLQKHLPGVTQIKRISYTAAWNNGESREIGYIDRCGQIHPIAKVNGKGYVENLARYDEGVMHEVLKKSAEQVARTIPCKGEGSMYHYSYNGPAKVF